MLVQTSMAHAFANINLTMAQRNKIINNGRTTTVCKTLDRINGALRAKVGTINVPDRINLTSGTYRRCRAVDMLPAHMM